MTFYVVIKYVTLDGPPNGNGHRDNLALVRVDLPFEQYHNPPSYDLYATAARFALAAFDKYRLSKRFDVDDKTRPMNASVAGVIDAGYDITSLFPKSVKRLEAFSNVRRLRRSISEQLVSSTRQWTPRTEAARTPRG